MENLNTLLSDFDGILDEKIDSPWSAKSPAGYMEAMAKSAKELSQNIIFIGDAHHTALLENKSEKPEEIYSHYFINFIWADRAKSLLILWCDVLFQYQKAFWLKSDGYATSENLKLLRIQSKAVIDRAAKDLKSLVNEDKQKLTNQKKGVTRQINRWKLQHNPWPLYRKQINGLAEQCLQLIKHFEEIKKAASGFQECRKLIDESIKICLENIKHYKSTGQTAYKLIEEAFEPGKEIRPGKLVAKLEDIEAGLIIPEYRTLFVNSQEKFFNYLPHKTQVPIQMVGGIIYLREINFNRAVKQWLDSEIMPILYEIWELTEGAQFSLKMSLFNVQNHMAVISTDLKEKKVIDIKIDDFSQFLKAFTHKLADAEEGIGGLQKIIKKRLQTDFKITGFYKAESTFLQLPLQSTVSRFRLGKIRFFDKVKYWLSKQLKVVRQFQKSVEKEASLSEAEKIMRFIKYRQPDADNHYYNSIFLTKGFIGETFWVGREAEIEHMESLIKSWKEGFRGAVAITGQRLSGKSLFGYYVSEVFFRDQSVFLSPNSVINVRGRQMNTSYDLEEALSFIKKNSINHPLLIWMDDLELWSHPSFPISRNIQMLLKFMDENPDNIFFLVSMSKWFKAYLDRFFNIKKAFQAGINMDKMSLDNIQEAILIRHGATHKRLMTQEGIEINPQQFQKIISKVYQAAAGNIGEALLYWSGSIKKINADEVIFNWAPKYNLPDFIDSNTGLLLASIMKERKTNEYNLRKLFGPAYNESYAVILQRLFGLGLLSRLPDGMLEVNEMVANELGQMLEQKNFIHFSDQIKI